MEKENMKKKIIYGVSIVVIILVIVIAVVLISQPKKEEQKENMIEPRNEFKYGKSIIIRRNLR